MNLLGAVVALLHERATPFAVIGAAAMAVHGVARSTRDLDLITLERDCLVPTYWDRVTSGGVEADVRTGQADDPLAGVVRLRSPAGARVDVVVGRSPWQSEIIGRAAESLIEGVLVPVARRADLILLKLYAGGPQDFWDIQQLLEGPERAETIREVERGIGLLPGECQAHWRSIRGAA